MFLRTPRSLASVFIFTALLSQASLAQEVTNIPQVGKHHRPLIVEKSINRQNILSAYTKVDDDCRLLTDRSNRNTPIIDFYWLNNRISYEPLDATYGPMIKQRLKIEASGDRETAYVRLVDLGSMRHDLPDPRIRVKADENVLTGKCSVEATLQMGPSDRNSVIKVETIYLDIGMMGGVNAIHISGRTKITGRTITKKYVTAGGW